MSDEDLPFSRTCYFCERARYVTYLYKDSWVDLCKRFGWAYSSDTPDRYIDFAKVSQNKAIDIVKGDKILELEKELNDIKLREHTQQQKIENQQQKIEKLLLMEEALEIIFNDPQKKSAFLELTKR